MTSLTNAPARDVLTEEEAIRRADAISECAYRITLDLQPRSPTYRGDVTITFAASATGNLFFDFRSKTIESLEVNGQRATPDSNGCRLFLPGDLLASRNTVRVIYENEYDHTGDGFHQFIDPQDNEEYLYTNFEPFEAHRLFPCFDQPDIKATYELTVSAPREWEVISNSPMQSREDQADGRARRSFATTKPFSTYLFCIVAGPYHEFRDQHGAIPIGLYCRKSLVQYLDTEEVFTVTMQGLDFYAGFFAYPYPFEKYDQVFVPEFNAGAMENVGCVTHNETFIHREPPTDNQRRRRAEVILHEMAHMWFGDLVTMKWWNDLWLNESFATYMAYLAMSEATRFDTGWLDFASNEKAWGYRQDQLVTTHPISGTVDDTDQTFQNFDGITYAKGASVIKQLVAAIGMDGFRAGMRHYFATYAFSNTTLEQFLQALEVGSNRPLGDWAAKWLETASLNTIGADWESDGDRITSFALWQTAPAEHPTLRPHYLEIGLLHDLEGQYRASVIPARIDGPRTEIPEAIGRPRPLLVFPNYGDHDWSKVALDPESVAFVRDHIDEIDDTLLRQMLWTSLSFMVRDAQLKSIDFLDLVRRKLPGEPNISLLDSVLNQAAGVLGRFVPDDQRDHEANALFEAARATLHNTANADARIIWTRNLIGFATVPRNVEYCAGLADGSERIQGVEIDQEMRWAIAQKFAGYGMAGAQERIAAESERDPSDRGQRARLAAETSFASPEVKAAAWERFHGEGYGSAHLTFAAMRGFNWWKQAALLRPYADSFFDGIAVIFRDRDKEFSEQYFGHLYPSYRVEQDTIDRGERIIREIGDELPTLTRRLLEANDDLARAIRCRAFALG